LGAAFAPALSAFDAVAAVDPVSVFVSVFVSVVVVSVFDEVAASLDLPLDE
jgi:hypothetical protein